MTTKPRVSLKPLEPFLVPHTTKKLEAEAPDALHAGGYWQGLGFTVSQDASGYTHLSLSTDTGPASSAQIKAFMRMWGVKPVGGRMAIGRASHWEVEV